MPFGLVRRGVRRLFRLAIRSPRRASNDAAEELRAFLDARIEQLRALGATPDAARDEAIRRLGGSYDDVLRQIQRSAQQRERRMTYRDMLDDLRLDLRFALRGLRREPLMATFIVVALALGTGANAAMFSVVDRLLIRGPEHVTDPSRVVRIYRTWTDPASGQRTASSFGWVTYDILRTSARAFSGVAAYTIYSPGFAFGQGADAVLIPYGAATHDLFSMLGVKPRLGRFFNAAEDSPDAPQQVVVLGYRLWERAFGSDSDVIGRRITLGTKRYTVVGVAPRGFTGPELAPVDAWIPMALQSINVTDHWRTSWNAQWLRVVARLAPAVTPDQAASDATRAYRAAYTGDDPDDRGAQIIGAPLRFDHGGHESVEGSVSRWLVGVAAIVLLIACSNVANLLLARAVRRRREVAVRIALGAGRGRLVRLLLVESMTLAAIGGTAGVVVTWVVATLVRGVLLPGLEWPSAPVDARVLGVLGSSAIVVGIVTGLVPALRTSRPDLVAALRTSASDGGRQASRLRAALTIAQAALSVVLLVGAGLFVKSLGRIHALNLGIEPDRILVAQLRYATSASTVDPKAAGEVERRTGVLLQAMARARELPDMEHASLTVGLPFQSSFGLSLRVPGWDSVPRLKGGDTNVSAVGSDYFATVGTRLIQGRVFTAADRRGSEPVAIVSRLMATTLWPGRSPLGECLYWGVSDDSLNVCSRIVGVVDDTRKFALREEGSMQYYIPIGQQKGIGGTSLLLRPRPGREAAVAAAVRRLVMEIDPSVAFVGTQMLQESVDPMIQPWRMGATIFTLMGGLALVVAAIGLYSVLSYLVAQRTKEIGVRIALGARRARIVTLVLKSGVGMVLIGIAIGTVGALLGGGLLAPLLFDTSPRDPVILVGVAVSLLLVAVAAAIIPSARAVRVDPMTALRAE